MQNKVVELTAICSALLLSLLFAAASDKARSSSKVEDVDVLKVRYREGGQRIVEVHDKVLASDEILSSDEAKSRVEVEEEDEVIPKVLSYTLTRCNPQYSVDLQ